MRIIYFLFNNKKSCDLENWRVRIQRFSILKIQRCTVVNIGIVRQWGIF
jgi:hypothetical protein